MIEVIGNKAIIEECEESLMKRSLITDISLDHYWPVKTRRFIYFLKINKSSSFYQKQKLQFPNQNLLISLIFPEILYWLSLEWSKPKGPLVGHLALCIPNKNWQMIDNTKLP